MTAPDPDAARLERARGGDDRAFAALVRPHADAVFAFLVRMTGHRDDAADVMQETLVRVWRSLESYRDEGRFAAWLFTIARNAALDRARSARLRSVGPLAEDVADPTADAAALTAYRELEADLDRALAGLPEPRRAVFVMRQESGLTFREIADALEIPLGTALSHMHHAVRALKEALRIHEP